MFYFIWNKNLSALLYHRLLKIIPLFNLLETIANEPLLYSYPLDLLSNYTRTVSSNNAIGPVHVALVVFSNEASVRWCNYFMRAQRWVFNHQRANPLSFRILCAPFIWESLPTRCARIILDWPVVKPSPVNTQLIYIYICNACFARSFAGRKIYRALRINFQGKGGGRNERSSCVTREIISSVRSVHVFFIRVDAEREREKERGKNDSIKFVWGEHPWMMSNVYIILSVIYRDCKSAR